MISIDLRGGQPIYEQIVEQYKYLLIQGYLKKGDSIPSVRKLALTLSITPGTVAKAYNELERQGIIETVRGKGTFIAGIPDKNKTRGDVLKVKEKIKKNCIELIYLGLSKKEIVEMVEELYDQIQKGEEKND